MELAGTALVKITEMFLILLLGAVLAKLNIIDSQTNKKLSNLLLMVVTPMLILSSYQMEFTMELLYGWLEALLLTILAFAIVIISSRFLVPKSEKWDVPLERIGLIYSNCGYIGVPLLSVLFGAEGVFYMTVYMTVFNILVWTQGVTLLTGKGSLKQMLKNLCSPMVISVFVGLFLFFTQLPIPSLLSNPIQMVGNINTPLAMIVAGASLADTNILQMLKTARIYLISALKLIVCPLLFIMIVGWFHWTELPLMTVYIATACPVGTTATLLALRYGRDNSYSTQLLAVSTILSIVTIPLMLMFHSWMLFVS